MSYQVTVCNNYQNGFAQTQLSHNNQALSELKINTHYLKSKICKFIPVAEDFFLIATTIYSLDKAVLRSKTVDKWTRTIEVTIPVQEQQRWAGVAEQLAHCVGFLTGDRWNFTFVARSTSLFMPQTLKRNQSATSVAADAVCLFSGGIDSLVGAIDWLEEHTTKKLLLVGHYDGKVPGTHADQLRVLEKLSAQYGPEVLEKIFVGVTQDPPGSETSFRSRSILFLALGILFASSLGKNLPLLIPENGAIALNSPLSPSRRGTCSTRTAHPYFLDSLRKILKIVQLQNPILNPHSNKTKGEVLKLCRNMQSLQQTIPVSISCAKRNRRGSWQDRTAMQCGRCMPCIYRRAALHSVIMDNEGYGNNICNGDVDIDGPTVSANDLRAFLSFLKIQASKEAVASSLRGTSKMEYAQFTEAVDIVWRASNEVRALIRDKGVTKIKHAAGL